MYIYIYISLVFAALAGIIHVLLIMECISDHIKTFITTSIITLFAKTYVKTFAKTFEAVEAPRVARSAGNVRAGALAKLLK